MRTRIKYAVDHSYIKLQFHSATISPSRKRKKEENVICQQTHKVSDTLELKILIFETKLKTKLKTKNEK